jgi:hypothetical protein
MKTVWGAKWERPRGDASDDVATVGGGVTVGADAGAANRGQLDWLGVHGLEGPDGCYSAADEGLPPPP